MVDFSQGFAGLRSMADYQRAEEEFQLKKQLQKAQLQAAQAELSKPQSIDLENIANQAIYKSNLGGEISPEEQAAIKTLATIKGQKTQYQTDELGNVRAVTTPNPYETYLGGAGQKAQSGGGFLPAPVSQEPLDDFVMPVRNTPRLPDTSRGSGVPNANALGDIDMTQLEGLLAKMPVGNGAVQPKNVNATILPQRPNTNFLDKVSQIDPEAAASPFGRKEAIKTELETQKDLTKIDYQSAIDTAKEELKTSRGQEKIKTLLSRMGKINDTLKEMGAIVSADQPYLQRLAAASATSDIGQGVRKFNDPQAQALAEEYKRLQTTMLPLYAAAAGLGAKAFDSEKEMQSILNSFGSPSDTYEANANQLYNLGQQFGEIGPRPVFDKKPTMPKGGMGEIEFKLKKVGATPEEIKEYLKLKGGN